MKQLLTVDELIQRIKVQNGAVVQLFDMEWVLRVCKLERRAVLVSDIPRIMDELLASKMVANTDMIDRKGRDVSTLHGMDAAVEMRRLTKWSEDLAAWVVESSTDAGGQIIKHEIDAALGGETWVPGWMVHNGKRMTLASTVYRVEDV